MQDLTMTPRGTVNTKRLKVLIGYPNTVRIYTHSPGHVALQMRREKDYTTVVLSLDEASHLARLLGVVLSDS